MQEINEYKKMFLGYSIITLKRLEYSEKQIREFILEINDIMQFTKKEKAMDTINIFFDDCTKQVIFEGNKIPIEYNMMKIKELFENFEFSDKKHKSLTKRVCNAFENNNIVFIKDLYDKERKKLINIRNISIHSYNIFVETLNIIIFDKKI